MQANKNDYYKQVDSHGEIFEDRLETFTQADKKYIIAHAKKLGLPAHYDEAEFIDPQWDIEDEDTATWIPESINIFFPNDLSISILKGTDEFFLVSEQVKETHWICDGRRGLITLIEDLKSKPL